MAKITIQNIGGGFCKIRNGGGIEARRFLETHSRHFLRMSDGPGQTCYAIEARRVPKLEDYISGLGLEVERIW